MKKYILLVIILLIMFETGHACSALYYETKRSGYVGANLDGEGNWDGLAFINARNIRKYTDMYNNGPAMTWTSRFGSVSFNLVCREYAQYGMNEAGLIITTVSDPKSIGPEADGRPEMIGNFWVQYALDVCATLEEVKQSLETVRIMPGTDRYLLTDKTGNCLVIEFIDGKIIYYEGNDLPVSLITNQSYRIALQHYLAKTCPEEPVFDKVTTQRFIKGADLMSKFVWLPMARVPYVFEMLRQIGESPSSAWRLVFDQTNKTINFYTRNNMRLRTIDLRQLDFNRQNGFVMLEINAKQEGDVSGQFSHYDMQRDATLYLSTMKNIHHLVTREQVDEHIGFLNTFYQP